MKPRRNEEAPYRAVEPLKKKVFWTLSIIWKSKITTFRKLDLLPFSGETGRETPTLFGPLHRANLNHWTDWSRHSFWRSCYLVISDFRTMDKVHKPISSQCYVPSSERFGIYFNICRFWNLSIFWILFKYTTHCLLSLTCVCYRNKLLSDTSNDTLNKQNKGVSGLVVVVQIPLEMWKFFSSSLCTKIFLLVGGFTLHQSCIYLILCFGG
jgi:hypothetical protein